MVETRFPRWADRPAQFLIWEIDDLIPLMTTFVLFLPSRSLHIGLAIGYVVMRLYRRAKEKLPLYWYLHYLWVWGVWTPKGRSTLFPKGYISRYSE